MIPQFSAAYEFQPAQSHETAAHFENKLSLEVDPADVHFDIENGLRNFVLIDTRSASDYASEHIPGAISLPYRHIVEETTKTFPRDKVLVTYCLGPACNASTKGALRLAKLGFQVKEMIGGIDGWKSDGLSTET